MPGLLSVLLFAWTHLTLRAQPGFSDHNIPLCQKLLYAHADEWKESGFERLVQLVDEPLYILPAAGLPLSPEKTYAMRLPPDRIYVPGDLEFMLTFRGTQFGLRVLDARTGYHLSFLTLGPARIVMFLEAGLRMKAGADQLNERIAQVYSRLLYPASITVRSRTLVLDLSAVEGPTVMSVGFLRNAQAGDVSRLHELVLSPTGALQRLEETILLDSVKP